MPRDAPLVLIYLDPSLLLCPACGHYFLPPSRGMRAPTYCSNSCRQASFKRRKTAGSSEFNGRAHAREGDSLSESNG